jgi:hypothetical protein
MTEAQEIFEKCGLSKGTLIPWELWRVEEKRTVLHSFDGDRVAYRLSADLDSGVSIVITLLAHVPK